MVTGHNQITHFQTGDIACTLWRRNPGARGKADDIFDLGKRKQGAIVHRDGARIRGIPVCVDGCRCDIQRRHVGVEPQIESIALNGQRIAIIRCFTALSTDDGDRAICGLAKVFISEGVVAGAAIDAIALREGDRVVARAAKNRICARAPRQSIRIRATKKTVIRG